MARSLLRVGSLAEAADAADEPAKALLLYRQALELGLEEPGLDKARRAVDRLEGRPAATGRPTSRRATQPSR